jgi:hypothetical protein
MFSLDRPVDSQAVRAGARHSEEHMTSKSAGFVAVALVAAFGCSTPASPPSPPETASAAAGPYTPGLGEIMSLQQMRHAKLWFAGEAQNWDLASYELDELGEGFDDAVRFHPTHKDSPVPLGEVVPNMGTALVAEVRKAVDAKDTAAFERAFDGLTAGCNNCHQATNFAFNRVRRPTTNPYPNQQFEPAK